MRYVVSSALLCARLQSAERVVMSKNNIAILSDFLFDVKGNVMDVTSSDGEIVMNTRLELQESTQDFKFAVDAKKCQDVLRGIPEQPLTLDVDPMTLQIRLEYQNGSAVIQGERGEDYPVPAAIEGPEQTVAVNAQHFTRALSAALTSTAASERKVMNGVHFDIAEGKLNVVASDGHKLIRYAIDIDAPEMALNVTLPQKAALVLKLLTEKLEGDITIRAYGRSNAVIETPDSVLRFRLIEDAYPNYRMVIPQNNPNVANIDRAALVGALRRVKVLSDKTTTLVKMMFENNAVTLTAEDINYAQSAEERLVCQYEGTPIRMGFKGTDLLDLLGNTSSEQLVLKLADPSKAGVIVPGEQTPGGDLIMLLMPLLINN